jgi:hypothetical protein
MAWCLVKHRDYFLYFTVCPLSLFQFISSALSPEINRPEREADYAPLCTFKACSLGPGYYHHRHILRESIPTPSEGIREGLIAVAERINRGTHFSCRNFTVTRCYRLEFVNVNRVWPNILLGILYVISVTFATPFQLHVLYCNWTIICTTIANDKSGGLWNKATVACLKGIFRCLKRLRNIANKN